MLGSRTTILTGGCDWRHTRARHRRDERSGAGRGQLRNTGLIGLPIAGVGLVGDWMALTRPRLVLGPAQRRPRSSADHDGAKHGDQRLMAAGAYSFRRSSARLSSSQHSSDHGSARSPLNNTRDEEQQRLGMRLETGGETTASATGRARSTAFDLGLRNTPEARRRQNRPRVWDRDFALALHGPL